MADKHGVEAFQIGEDDELLQRRVVAEVALGAGMGVAPLFGGLAEKGDVEQVAFVGIDKGGLGLGDGGWDEGVLDGVGVDAVIDLGEGALEVPVELEAVVFVVLEALKLLDEVNLEFRAEPGTELEGNFFVGVSAAAVTPSFRLKSDGTSCFDPFTRGEEEAVEAGVIFKGLEFETFKIRVVDLFPDADEFEGVAVTHPTVDPVCPPKMRVWGGGFFQYRAVGNFDADGFAWDWFGSPAEYDRLA